MPAIHGTIIFHPSFSLQMKSTGWRFKVPLLLFAACLGHVAWRATREEPAGDSQPTALTRKSLARKNAAGEGPSTQRATGHSFKPSDLEKLRSHLDHELALADEGNESQLIHKLCSEMTLETLPTYLALLQGFDTEHHGTYLRQRLDLSIHQRWLELAPEEALLHAKRHWSAESGATGEVIENTMEILLTTLAAKFPELARQHYAHLTTESERLAMLRTLGIQDPYFALGELEKLPASDQRQSAFASLITHQFTEHANPSTEFSKWAAALKDPVLAGQLQLEIISQSPNLSPEQAFIKVQEITTDTREKTELSQNLFQQWLVSDGTKAVDWLTQNEAALPLATRQDYYHSLTASMPDSRRAEITDWLSGQTNDGKLDKAFRYLALSQFKENPAESERWLQGIRDQEMYSKTKSQIETLAKNKTSAGLE
jgi:hypothetical protein